MHQSFNLRMNTRLSGLPLQTGMCLGNAGDPGGSQSLGHLRLPSCHASRCHSARAGIALCVVTDNFCGELMCAGQFSMLLCLPHSGLHWV